MKLYQDDEIKTILITTTWASVSYMMMTRCGINAKDQIQRAKGLSYIKILQQPRSSNNIRCTSVSDIAEMGLREIARTVCKSTKKEKN